MSKHTLKDWRLLKGISQKSLAELLGVSQSTVSLAEKGNINDVFIKKFAEKYESEINKIEKLNKRR